MISLSGKGNFVSVILQCRGDSYGPKCRSCYAIALSGIDYENNFCMHNSKNVSGDQNSFLINWTILLSNVTSIALEKGNNDPIDTAIRGGGEEFWNV
ncbi:unnamed protein product [Arabis nemorensis]|uniref:Gnk2-homologous domain-containing protein n=1 Tax=Arabis nemorensis TaxID=586526 RepID=A0A565BH82_9BRAS|nr:unnamed protein product [Arabis nemorensis]